MERNLNAQSRSGQVVGLGDTKPASCASDGANCASAGCIERGPQFGFDGAIAHLKRGGAVRRASWPRHDRFSPMPSLVFMTKGSVYFSETDTIPPTVNGVKRALFDDGATGTVTRMPNLAMSDCNGTNVNGWSPSQADLFAEDWQVV